MNTRKRLILELISIICLILSFVSALVIPVETKHTYRSGVTNSTSDESTNDQAETLFDIIEKLQIKTLAVPPSENRDAIQLTPIEEDFVDETPTSESTEESVDTIDETPPIPKGHYFKSYTSYTLLNKSSLQWKLQELAYTDENGLRKIDDNYLVALGSYYGTTLGDIYIVTLDTGAQFHIVLCDCKDDRDTNSTHQWTTLNGCMTEFYVDVSVMSTSVKRSGTISSIPGFEGDIINIERTGVNVLNES